MRSIRYVAVLILAVFILPEISKFRHSEYPKGWMVCCCSVERDVSCLRDGGNEARSPLSPRVSDTREMVRQRAGDSAFAGPRSPAPLARWGASGSGRAALKCCFCTVVSTWHRTRRLWRCQPFFYTSLLSPAHDHPSFSLALMGFLSTVVPALCPATSVGDHHRNPHATR